MSELENATIGLVNVWLDDASIYVKELINTVKDFESNYQECSIEEYVGAKCGDILSALDCARVDLEKVRRELG